MIFTSFFLFTKNYLTLFTIYKMAADKCMYIIKSIPNHHILGKNEKWFLR